MHRDSDSAAALHWNSQGSASKRGYSIRPSTFKESIECHDYFIIKKLNYICAESFSGMKTASLVFECTFASEINFDKPKPS